MNKDNKPSKPKTQQVTPKPQQYTNQAVQQNYQLNNIQPQQNYQLNSIPLQQNYNQAVQQNYQLNNIAPQLNSMPSMYQQSTTYNSINTVFTSSSNLNNIFTNLGDSVENSSETKLPIASIIITLCHGSSYDPLFTTVKQKPPEGSRILLYALQMTNIKILNELLTKGKLDDGLKKTIVDTNEQESVSELIKEISDIEPDCVLFNFECCSGVCCSNQKYSFPDKKAALELLEISINKGYQVMLSDFSVKAFVNDWDEKILGPKSLLNIGTVDHAIKLRFKPDTLKGCESAQLRIVGELAAEGIAVINVMGGTVVIGVDKKKTKNEYYKFEILTEVEKKGNIIQDSFVDEKEKTTIGHAMLKYKSGSIITVSAGHWVELNNINVDIRNIEKVADKYWKGDYSEQINSMKMMEAPQQKKMMQDFAKNFVQQTSNCNYSAKIFKK